ncbi:hypothetical protein J2T38_002310 [Neisseria perflava]|nr:hypothetical protein [Neisseria perflava]
MTTKYMTNLRINETEQKLIRELYMRINTERIKKGLIPIQESQMTHKILIKALKMAKLDENGEISIV